MLNSYTTTTQTVPQNSPINFDINRVSTNCNCAISHAEGTPTFRISKCGYYFVAVNATATNATGTVSFELQNNSTYMTGTSVSQSVGAAADVVTQTFIAIVPVLPSCRAVDNTASLMVVNTGSAADYTNVNIVITKLD